MSAELSSIATKVLDKKTGKLSGLAALMKAGFDDKAFEEKLKKAMEKGLKDGKDGKDGKDNSVKPMVVNIKQDTKSTQVSTQNDTKKSIKTSDASNEHQSEMAFRHALALSKMSNELTTEKTNQELRTSTKGDKKLSNLLEKMDSSGVKGNIKVEQLHEDDIGKDGINSKKTKKLTDKKDEKQQTHSSPVAAAKESDAKKTASDEQKVKSQQPQNIQQHTTDTKQVATKEEVQVKKEIKNEAPKQKVTDDEQVQKNQKISAEELENHRLQAKKDKAEKADLETVAPKDMASVKKEIKEPVDIKKDNDTKLVKVEEKKPSDDKKEPVDIKKDAGELLSQRIATRDISFPVVKNDEKSAIASKKIEEKPINLQELLTNLGDVKVKKDESLEKKNNSENKNESKNEDAGAAHAKATSMLVNTTSIEDSIAQKIKDAPVVLKNFAEDLKDKIDEYKPPIMKVSMELRPENMAPVDVTMITRGQNLIININSSDEALKMFMSNASDFRQNLMNIGFTEMTMNFNFKDQNGEQRQYQHQEQGTKKYKEAIDSVVSMTNVEVIVPQYA